MIIPNGVNASLVTLILKTPDDDRVINFRPIVMGKFLFKFFMKILTTRLDTFIGQYVSPLQFGFISGRKIHTTTILASDAMNFLDLGCFSDMAVKINMMKVFDTIS